MSVDERLRRLGWVVLILLVSAIAAQAMLSADGGNGTVIPPRDHKPPEGDVGG